jgi:hypothetical protein
VNCTRFIKAALVALSLLPFAATQAAVNMGELERQSAAMREREAKIWKEREATQRVELQKQEKSLAEAAARRQRADGIQGFAAPA